MLKLEPNNRNPFLSPCDFKETKFVDFVFVCVCVRGREKERKIEREKENFYFQFDLVRVSQRL